MNILDKTIGAISLGCDKNRVDLEKMLGNLESNGFNITNDITKADIVIINTCSFILDARKESIETILNTAKLKGKGVEKIIVTGCLNNMNYTDLSSSLPEVDAFVPVQDNDKIVSIVHSLYGNTYNVCAKGYNRMVSTPKHYAYLKIADGCNNFCSYCTIPYIRGRFHSYSLHDLVDEAKQLVKSGARELILVAQDVTKYGADFNNGTTIVTLIRELSKISNLKLIRLLYCYPDLITDELINEVTTNPKVAKYLDIPLQHINNTVLKQMNRRTSKEQIIDVITKLRSACPDITIRTTFILGFPGETNEQFQELCQFVKDYKLDNVGFFKYSREEGTRAYDMPNQVNERTKTMRVNKLSKLQLDNVIEHNQAMIGKQINVVVDEVDNGVAICRASNMCPQVDPVVFVKGNNIKIGDQLHIQITTYEHYDLIGEIL